LQVLMLHALAPDSCDNDKKRLPEMVPRRA